MNVRIARGGINEKHSDINENQMASIVILLLAIVFCAIVFLILRYNVYIVEAPQIPLTDANKKMYIDGFDHFRDFATTICELFAVLFTASAVVAFITYKNIKKEEARLSKFGNKFEILLKIEESRIGSDPESNPDSAVNIFNDMKLDINDGELFFVLKGDAFCKRGNDGDYGIAERLYDTALNITGSSAKVWLGLGQAKFRSVLGNMEYREASELDIADVANFKIANNHYCVQGENVAVVKEAIRCTEKAISCGYSKPTALFEIAKMYEAINEMDLSLEKYKESYELDENNSVNGFYYSYTWLKVNFTNLSHPDIGGIVRTLKQVGMMNLYHSKTAYALLWYLYCVVPGLGDATAQKKALAATNQYVIDDIFEM